MYATCLFCQKDLGRNESLESFPVGKRLAFDAAKGRLWVVCPSCERWNLSPLEERWEAIDQAERLYRDTRQRVATDNIGLAKLRDGTTLVRIGEPLRPEFAAWRYGDQFGRRRRRQLFIAGAGVSALGALIIGGATAGIGVGGFGWMIAQAGRAIVRGNPESIVARIKAADGRMLPVRRRHLRETSIEGGNGAPMAINLRFKNGAARFEGEQALHVASRVLPAVNRYGGSKQTVAEAVNLIEREGSPDRFIDTLSRTAAVTTAVQAAFQPGETIVGGVRVRRLGRRGRWSSSNADWSTGLFALHPAQRLALEMALHEEAERQALAGELSTLEAAWQEAEEIAAISDSLFVTPAVDRALDDLKHR